MTQMNNPKLNELAGIVKDMPPGKIRTALVKDQAIYIRVTTTDKESIKQTASKLRLSVGESLNQFASTSLCTATETSSSVGESPETLLNNAHA